VKPAAVVEGFEVIEDAQRAAMLNVIRAEAHPLPMPECLMELAGISSAH
jgi:hypothetical protein